MGSGTFKNFKQRGEWVELQFMATVAAHGYRILKPWGDSLEYDAAIEHGGEITLAQVKSARKGEGYLCRLRHGGSGEQRYTPDEVDLFAIYVIPAKTWYLIPNGAVFRPAPKMNLKLYPYGLSRRGHHDDDHDYEHYREAWGLLAKPRRDLAKAR